MLLLDALAYHLLYLQQYSLVVSPFCAYISKQVSEINELKTMVKNLITTLDNFSNLTKVHPEDSQSSTSLASSNIQSANQTSTALTNAIFTNELNHYLIHLL